jgi:hypothetical protein
MRIMLAGRSFESEGAAIRVGRADVLMSSLSLTMG